MKVALCQVNPIVGAFDYNQDLILSNYKKAISHNVDVVVFPELIVSGYPPQDLVWEAGFLEENTARLNQIANQTTVPLILGYIRQDHESIFNSAAVCQNGKIDYTYDKQLLPTYDVFDEARYFTPGNKAGLWKCNIDGKILKIGLEICEDLWDDAYSNKVTRQLIKSGADCIINISASPFHENRLQDRISTIKRRIKDNPVAFIYCNMVGAQDEIIFDGQSIILNRNQEVVAVGKGFEEDLAICDINTASEVIKEDTSNLNEGLYRALCLGVHDYFNKTGHQKAIVSVSGGIDSAVVACIATDALGKENVKVVAMPSKYSSDHSLEDAHQLAINLGLELDTIPIQPIVDQYGQSLKGNFENTEPNSAEENIQARVRGNLIMALANKFGWMVLSTGNKTELALGYCTLYGDMSGGLAVISDLSKEDVYRVARWVNESAGYDRIPKNTIVKQPSAELTDNQVDPFDYEIVSPLVDALIENQESTEDLVRNGYDENLIRQLSKRIRINEFKRRQAAPGLRVSKKAFGLGRRIPIVNHYQGK